jgi:hypothetical protein
LQALHLAHLNGKNKDFLSSVSKWKKIPGKIQAEFTYIYIHTLLCSSKRLFNTNLHGMVIKKQV